MIIRLLIVVLILFLLYKLLRKGISIAGRRSGAAPPAAVGEDLVEDPLCHTYVPLSHACQATIRGKTVYFCSRKCLEQYEREQKKEFMNEKGDAPP